MASVLVITSPAIASVLVIASLAIASVLVIASPAIASVLVITSLAIASVLVITSPAIASVLVITSPAILGASVGLAADCGTGWAAGAAAVAQAERDSTNIAIAENSFGVCFITFTSNKLSRLIITRL